MSRDSDALGLARELGEEVAKLRAQIETLQSASHLTNAALEDTSIKVKDRDGSTRAIMGRQSDGSHGAAVVEAGPQPVPSVPLVEPGTGTISVEWDGELANETVSVPRIFGRVEVWAAPDDGSDDPTRGKRLGSITDREGGATPIKATPGEWRVWLRMVGPDGKRASGFSQSATARVDALVDEQDIEDWINAFSDGELPDAAYNNLAARLGRFIEVEADNISANAIEGQHIAFGALDGQIITAPLVQSHEESQTGWKLDPSGGFQAWDDGGTQTIRLDGVSNLLTGRLQTSATGGQGVIIDQGDIEYYSAVTDEIISANNVPYIRVSDGSTAESDQPTIANEGGSMVIAPGVYGQGTRRTVVVDGTLSIERASVGGTISASAFTADGGGSTYLNGDRLQIQSSSSSQPAGIRVSGARTRLTGRMSDGQGEDDMFIAGAAGSYTVDPGSGLRGSVTYGSPTPQGSRRPAVWAHVSRGSYDDYDVVNASSSGLSGSGFDWTARGDSGNGGVATFWLYYLAQWR